MDPWKDFFFMFFSLIYFLSIFLRFISAAENIGFSFTGIRQRLLNFYESLDSKIICPYTCRDHHLETELIREMPVDLERSDEMDFWKKLIKIDYALRSSEEFLRYLAGPQESFEIKNCRKAIVDLQEEIKYWETTIFPEHNGTCFSNLHMILRIALYTTDIKSAEGFRNYFNTLNWTPRYLILANAFTHYARNSENENDAKEFLNDFVAQIDPYIQKLYQTREELGLERINLGERVMFYFYLPSNGLTDFMSGFYVSSLLAIEYIVSRKFEGDEGRINSILAPLFQKFIETQQPNHQIVTIRNKVLTRSFSSNISPLLAPYFRYQKASIGSPHFYDEGKGIRQFLRSIWGQLVYKDLRSIYDGEFDLDAALNSFRDVFELDEYSELFTLVSRFPKLNLIPPPIIVRVVKVLMLIPLESCVIQILERFEAENSGFYAEEYLNIAIEHDNAAVFSVILKLLENDEYTRFSSTLLLPLIRRKDLNILKRLSESKQCFSRFDNSEILLKACMDLGRMEEMKYCLKIGCNPRIENPAFRPVHLVAIKEKLLNLADRQVLASKAYASNDWEILSALAWNLI